MPLVDDQDYEKGSIAKNIFRPQKYFSLKVSIKFRVFSISTGNFDQNELKLDFRNQ